MGLTDSATLILVALLTVATPMTCLLVWNRLSRWSWLRVSVRAVLLVTSQGLAVLLVGLDRAVVLPLCVAAFG